MARTNWHSGEAVVPVAGARIGTCDSADTAQTKGFFRMFRRLSDQVFASEQIDVAAVAEAAAQGITLIINNRPEDESADQTPGAAIAAAAAAAGMAYRAIPVTHAGFSESQVNAMADALAGTDGPVLAYCRSGTRSTLLWALAEARRGVSPHTLTTAAAEAGYDVTPVRAIMDMLAASKA
ncbi:TIGR01244 family sulfur transferase [Novosphingobium sp.]|uniref:TIGR01244 family sulfur transferase n=1 Tax=Novosphingobium sp. TaxID=1874826 RepID=UPI00286BEC56|nr:TIGR01244 family sulfur transferase [Novosphingobium sp.]